MSQATKRKHVTKEVTDNYVIPEEPMQIVRIIAGRGNNLHLVETSSGENFLVSMPTKFRRNVWVKRGNYVVVEPIEEGDKVKAEIVQILLNDQIKYIKSEGKWPEGFNEKTDDDKMKIDDANRNEQKDAGDNLDDDEEEEEDDDDDLFTNPNHRYIEDELSDEDEEEDDDDDEEEDEDENEKKEKDA